MFERKYLFDNLKALLIFFVVLAHYIRVSGSFDPASFGGVIYIIAFSFIMQGFLFVSGYFSKNVQKCRRGAVKNFLLPYFLLQPIMFAVRYLLFGHATLDFLEPSVALWYLLVLFAYRFFIKDLARIPGILPISFAIFLLAGCIPALGEEFALGRTVSFLLFFMLGYGCEPRHIEKIKRIPKKYMALLLSMLIVISWIIAYSELIPVEMWHFKEGYSVFHMSNVEGILIRLFLGAVSLCWLLVMIGLTPEKKTVLSQIGKRTMTIYILHIPIRYAIKAFGAPGDGNVLSYLIIFMITIISIYFFSRPVVCRVYNTVISFIYEKLLIGTIGMVKRIFRIPSNTFKKV